MKIEIVEIDSDRNSSTTYDVKVDGKLVSEACSKPEAECIANHLRNASDATRQHDPKCGHTEEKK